MNADVQIVVATHQAERPVERAVAQVLTCPQAAAIVVAHNLDQDVVKQRLRGLDSSRITLISCLHGAGHPGVPFNVGIAAASAPWVGIMGSDDWFEEGALAAYLSRAHSDKADGVIAPLRHPATGKGKLPFTARTRNLHPVRDRLFYRTAPLGIFRTEIMQDPDMAFANDVETGEDQRVSLRLWTSHLQISYSFADPAYVVGADAEKRVTLTPRPAAELAALWARTWDDAVTQQLPSNVRFALAVKQARIDLLTAARSRLGDGHSGECDAHKEADCAALSSAARRLAAEVPGFLGVFQPGTARILQALIGGDQLEVNQALSKEFALPPVRRGLPSRLRYICNAESPVRYWATGLHIARSEGREEG